MPSQFNSGQGHHLFMSRTIGIIGLPNVGKSTIFNTLTDGHAHSSNYPFCTIEPNIGIVPVPDEKLVRLNQLIKPKELTPASIKFMDLAGLIKGSSHGEGLGNRFLASARECDALLHVVRCFEDKEITHVEKDLNPGRDIDIINIELCLADLEMAEKRLEKVSKLAKTGDKDASCEVRVLEDVREALKRGEMVKTKELSLPLLTLKPIIYLANTGEKDLDTSKELIEKINAKVSPGNSVVIKVAGKLENELKRLSKEEGNEFREAWAGEKETPLHRLVQGCYEALNLITFYTIAREKLSAWPLNKGEEMLRAAGKVHSDMQDGFIKAEVINFKEFIETGSYNLAREKGYLKIVGRDYAVQDGDIVYVHFSKRV